MKSLVTVMATMRGEKKAPILQPDRLSQSENDDYDIIFVLLKIICLYDRVNIMQT